MTGSCCGVLAIDGGVWWPGSGGRGRGGAVAVHGGVKRRVRHRQWRVVARSPSTVACGVWREKKEKKEQKERKNKKEKRKKGKKIKKGKDVS